MSNAKQITTVANGITVEQYDSWVKGENDTVIKAGDDPFRSPSMHCELELSIHWRGYDSLATVSLTQNQWIGLSNRGTIGETIFQQYELLHHQYFTLTDMQMMRQTLDTFITALENGTITQ
jgi:hypothetical protein